MPTGLDKTKIWISVVQTVIHDRTTDETLICMVNCNQLEVLEHIAYAKGILFCETWFHLYVCQM